MIGLVLVAQMPDPRDVCGVSVLLGPIDRLFLGLKGRQNMVGVIFDNVILDRAAFRLALRARLDEYDGHILLPFSPTDEW